ncbi:MAG: primosomal protein N' [Deltaproteobacteria bacterium]|jgi:primosomal protein N' (replication factor Y)|nr:primosomal protein N' [Deltaproteobacteria bacterium]
MTAASPLTAQVAVDSPVGSLYTYLAPPEMDLKVGQMVQVSFGGRDVVGYIISLGQAAENLSFKLKPVRQVLKPDPLFGPAFIRLVSFVSQYYFYPIGLCIKDILPGGLSPKFRAVASLTEDGLEQEIDDEAGLLAVIRAKHPEKTAVESAEDRIQANNLSRLGLIKLDWEVEKKGVDFAWEWYLSPAAKKPEPLPRLGRKQQELWELLAGSPPMPLDHFRIFFANPLTLARGLAQKGLVELEKRQADRDDPKRAIRLPAVKVEHLTPDQDQALKAISLGLNETLADHQSRGYLLFGVTGSGKTEVYLRAAEKTMAQGRGVLWLAPEIALTLGLEGRLKEKFPGENISVLHSALSPGQRHDHWLKLVQGRSRLVLGARSAVFAPLINPGLIIVDEEHDWAFKQDDGLKYQGRDLAAWRARDEGAVLLLGSATPSLESYTAALSGRLTLLKLSSRPGESFLPPVELVDRRGDTQKKKVLTSLLAGQLTKTLEKGEQALLFLNRRGLANMPLCLSCGQGLKCPHCSQSLTLHGSPPKEEVLDEEDLGVLICHSCGHRAYPPKKCPVCGSSLVRYLGVGTEKLHKIVEKDFAVKALKLDTDSAGSNRSGLKRILESFGRAEAQVLIGTQMAAKGHDFPLLTLVGVVEADLGLNVPDFRAAERTFQVLSQVSGRAGRRDRPGQVLIQTANPDHYALKFAQKYDYEGFYATEAAYRRELGYPPFGRLALIRLLGPQEKAVEKAAQEAAKRARSLIGRLRIPGLELWGPAPAPVAKRRTLFRFQVMVRAEDHQGRLQLLRSWLPRLRKSLPKGITMTVDVDPYQLL